MHVVRSQEPLGQSHGQSDQDGDYNSTHEARPDGPHGRWARERRRLVPLMPLLPQHLPTCLPSCGGGEEKLIVELEEATVSRGMQCLLLVIGSFQSGHQLGMSVTLLYLSVCTRQCRLRCSTIMAGCYVTCTTGSDIGRGDSPKDASLPCRVGRCPFFTRPSVRQRRTAHPPGFVLSCCGASRTWR